MELQSLMLFLSRAIHLCAFSRIDTENENYARASNMAKLTADPDWRVGGPEEMSLEGPYDVFHDVTVCQIYVFADSQRSRLLFPVADYVLAV